MREMNLEDQKLQKTHIYLYSQLCMLVPKLLVYLETTLMVSYTNKLGVTFSTSNKHDFFLPHSSYY